MNSQVVDKDIDKDKKIQLSISVRLDASNHYYTQEGHLVVKTTVAKTGVYYYAKDSRNEAKLPEDLFNEASLQTLKGLPIISEHPYQVAGEIKSQVYTGTFRGLLDSSNTTWYIKGFTIGEPVIVDNSMIQIELKIIDQDLINEIETGVRDSVSLGAISTQIKESGVFNGERYTHKQTLIRYNHVAITDNPRLGDAVKIVLDSNNSILEIREGAKMKKVKLNGIEFSLEDETLASAIESVNTRLDSLIESDKTLSKENLELKSKVEDLQVKAVRLDSLEKEMLVKKAEAILGVGKVDAKLDSKDIMLQAIDVHFKGFKSDDEKIIQGRFDSIYDFLPTLNKQVEKEPQTPDITKVAGVTLDSQEEVRLSPKQRLEQRIYGGKKDGK